MVYRLIVMLIVSCTFAAANGKCATSGDNAARTSGIKDIWLHDNKVKDLANLGMLWGFIKYHHARVTGGGYDMDAELFRVLPLVLSTDNRDSVKTILERWVDGFWKPEPCKNCKPFVKTSTTKLEPDYGYLFEENNFPKSLRDKLDYIRLNRSSKSTSYYIEKAPYIGNPKFTNEQEYAATSFPDAGLRLLALYRYWNMIQYFCPNRHLIGEDWDRALGLMIPDFCNAADATEYQLACLKMVARINDTHAQLTTGDDLLKKVKGVYMTPFAAQFVEDKLVVIGYYKDTLGVKTLVKPGDIIEQIDGASIIDLVRKYLPFIPASNYEKKLSNMSRSAGPMLRSNNPEARLTISREGKLMQVTVPRIPADTSMILADYGTTPEYGYKMLNGNVGYLYPANLKDGDLDIIMDSFDKTRGIIIDFRCYPRVFMTFDYGKWLKPNASVFVQFTTMNMDVPGLFETGKTGENGGGRGSHYKGKVTILVNSRTQSSAEYQVMALQTAPGAKVIGSQTSGADGNVSEIMLPGGLKTRISGIGILYPDGTESQRTGVKIDKEVRPTITGIKEGKDEVLEEAMRMLND